MKKTDNEVYVLKQQNQLPYFDNRYQEGFDVVMDSQKLVKDRDFFYQIEVNPQEELAHYRFQFVTPHPNTLIQWFPVQSKLQLNEQGTLNQ